MGRAGLTAGFQHSPIMVAASGTVRVAKKAPDMPKDRSGPAAPPCALSCMALRDSIPDVQILQNDPLGHGGHGRCWGVHLSPLPRVR